ncbi:MAG TPA: NAD(P)/FAD-dependent oxidoreductase [Pseudolabrys sp.]|jgi:2-polyprenyl-6-methoxyphenol hydroxylase-like FAD-dependent oxidoreductase
MRETDVVIVGGGLAGSLAAAMLGKSGVDAVIVDPHPVYPPDFRCEKLDGVQVAILQKTGLADGVLKATTHDRQCWVARFGRLVDMRPSDQQGIFYAPLVNTIRGLIPPRVPMINAKVTAIATGSERQTVTLSTGATISARLVVLANGLNIGLRHSLGLARELLSECHSTTAGFDVTPDGRTAFDFPALTYYAERTSDRTALLTLFPIGATMRANLFTYRDKQDPWLRDMRSKPAETLHALMPRLHKLTGDFTVTGDVKIRPVDLCITHGHRQAGVVLVGDAFATSCPAAGTGARKALNDVERLCNIHIPRWLATPGMDLDKIANFYDDPVKQACDDACLAKAFDLRSFSTDPALPWWIRRRLKFIGQYAVGTLRRIGRQPTLRLQGHSGAPLATRVEI